LKPVTLLIVLLALSTAFESRVAHADEEDILHGDAMLASCGPNGTSADIFLCRTYLMGFQAGCFRPRTNINLYEFAPYRTMPPVRWCPPNNTGLQKMLDTVLKWLRDNPELRHLSAGIFVSKALNQAWPCPDPLPKE
jgi:hypothetical protein